MDECYGKTTYDSATVANRVAIEVNRRNKRPRSSTHNHAPARVYKCPNCGKYHLTSQKRKK